MALVMIARFEDPYEGEAAASSLRAAGIEAVFNNIGMASVDPFSARATGGTPLFVMTDDAVEARSMLKGLIGTRPPPLEAFDEDDTPQALEERQAKRLRYRQIVLGLTFFGPAALLILLMLFMR